MGFKAFKTISQLRNLQKQKFIMGFKESYFHTSFWIYKSRNLLWVLKNNKFEYRHDYLQKQKFIMGFKEGLIDKFFLIIYKSRNLLWVLKKD